MNKFARLAISISIIAAILFGCGHKFKMNKDSLSEKSVWQFHRLDAQNTGQIDGTFGGKLKVVWEQSTGTRPSGPLTLDKGLLVYPGSKKKIRVYDPRTGDFLGFIRTKGHTPTGLVIRDSLGYFVDGPRKVAIHCVNLLNRKTIWEHRVKDAVNGSIIVNNNLILSQTAGLVQAYDLVSGDEKWSFEAKERLLVPAAFLDDRIYQTGDKGSVFIFNAESGETISTLNLAGPFLGATVAADFVYLVNMNGDIYAVDQATDSIVWQASVAGPVWSSPAIDQDKLFITSNAGELTAFDSHTGAKLWQYDSNEVIKSSPSVIGKCVVFGTMYGNLLALNSADGTVLASREFSGAISQSPVSDGRFIFVATDEGDLVCLGDSNEITALDDK
ncbi:MAG: PQQ-binding-like beta-propeller repeat protein [Candidatus Zixiibacteriota bacterium]